MTTGVCFASTGGNKIVRAVRSFQRMEPSVPVHVTLATTTATFRNLHTADHRCALDRMGVQVKLIDSWGFVNGGLNEATRWMRDIGYDVVCLLHDDLVFSSLPEHRYSLSQWFTPPSADWPSSSGLTFAHFECFTADQDMRREPLRWDPIELEDDALWRDLMRCERLHNGTPYYPIQRDFYVRYEGTDRTRPWNRLGPTGMVIPIALWDQVGGFDETFGVFYDIDYPAEVRRRDLPPIYAVPNIPWLHLHNQSVNPGADFAPGAWGDTEGAFQRKFGKTLTGFWHSNWEERWLAIDKARRNATNSTPVS